MAVLGTLGSIDGKKNPPEALDKDGKPTRAYTIDDFLFYLPSFKNVTKKQSSNSLEFYENSVYYIGDTDEVATPSNSNALHTNPETGVESKRLYEKLEDGRVIDTYDTDFIPGKTYYKDYGCQLVATPKNCGLYETELQVMYNALFPIAYGKIFYTVFGKDWYYAMSLCIAHYNYLINIQIPNSISPNRKIGLSDVTGGGVTRGVMTNASIGGFSKTYDLGYTALTTEEALFWNQSSYGMSLLALFKSKATLTMFVVTNGPVIPGTPPFNRFGDRPWGSDWVDDMINPRKFRP